MLERLKKFDLVIYSAENLRYNTVTIIHFWKLGLPIMHFSVSGYRIFAPGFAVKGTAFRLCTERKGGCQTSEEEGPAGGEELYDGTLHLRVI